jgi:hypothetical protein
MASTAWAILQIGCGELDTVCVFGRDLNTAILLFREARWAKASWKCPESDIFKDVDLWTISRAGVRDIDYLPADHIYSAWRGMCPRGAQAVEGHLKLGHK